jgi:hypothetical protein
MLWTMGLTFFDSATGFTLPLEGGELVDFRPVRQDDREILQSLNSWSYWNRSLLRFRKNVTSSSAGYYYEAVFVKE